MKLLPQNSRSPQGLLVAAMIAVAVAIFPTELLASDKDDLTAVDKQGTEAATALSKNSKRQAVSQRTALLLGRYHTELAVPAAKPYGIPPNLLLALAMVESSLHPWSVNHAGKAYYFKSREKCLAFLATLDIKDSFDIGLMQINSFWLRVFGLTPQEALDPLTNFSIAARILAEEFRRYGKNWQAVAAYHISVLKNEKRARKYARKVLTKFAELNRDRVDLKTRPNFPPLHASLEPS